MVADHSRRPYFFVHVMKTAGTTFGAHIDCNFRKSEQFPGPDDATGADYWVIRRLKRAIEQRGKQVRIWRGHFPYFVTHWVRDAITLTLLRDPVSRTLSLLDEHRRTHDPEASLEALYDDPLIHGRTVRDHMTKVFSLTESDGVGSYLHVMELDEHRLTRAKANLDHVDVVGFQDRYDAFMDTLAHRYGWQRPAIERRHVGGTVEVPDSFRRLIAAENRLDVEFYEYAVASRAGGGPG